MFALKPTCVIVAEYAGKIGMIFAEARQVFAELLAAIVVCGNIVSEKFRPVEDAGKLFCAVALRQMSRLDEDAVQCTG